MSGAPLPYEMVNGIKCYSAEVASDYTNYPDSGFDVTDENVETSFWVTSRNRLFKAMILRQLADKTHAKLLEIGCGTGDFIRHLTGDKRLEITASEIYLKGLLYAKKNLPEVDFVQFDATKGTIGKEFDLIAAFDVLEHIEDDLAAFANIHTMLAADGVAIISVPQYMFLWSTLDELVHHQRRYSQKELLEKLDRSGFTVDYCTSFVFVLFPLMLLSRLFDRKKAPAADAEASLEKRVHFPAALNHLFSFFMRIDEWLISLRVPLPFGGTLIAVARKK